MDGLVVHREQRREVCKVLVGIPKRKEIEVIGKYGRIILKCLFKK
jgi:hypothetical protein